MEVSNKIIYCDHCGEKTLLENAYKTEWKEINLFWYYCSKCEFGVFGSNLKVGEANG